MEIRKERYIIMSEVCEIMRCTPRTIRRWMSAGKFPPGVIRAKKRVWRESDVVRIAEIGQPSKKQMTAIIKNASA